MSFYIVPTIGAGTRQDPKLPKYVPALGVSWAVVNWNGSSITWADASPAQDATIGANADAIVIPPIDNTINVSAVQTELEALDMPVQWVNSTMTYRMVLRMVCGMAQLLQRMAGQGTPVNLHGNLNKTMSQLSQAIRDSFTTAATSLGLDISQIDASTTVREVLRILGQEFIAGQSIHLGDL